MTNEIDRVTQRTRQYWFSDGIVELSIGAVFLFLGIYFYLQSRLEPGSPLLIGLQVGFVFLLIGSIGLSRRLVTKFKARLTAPRTGYVSYKRATRKQRLVSVFIVCLIALVNAVLILFSSQTINWVPLISGVIVAGLWLITAVRVSMLRIYFQAILALLLGGILSLINLDLYQSLAWFYGILGLVLVISGVYNLVIYLRRHPPLQENPQAG